MLKHLLVLAATGLIALLNVNGQLLPLLANSHGYYNSGPSQPVVVAPLYTPMGARLVDITWENLGVLHDIYESLAPGYLVQPPPTGIASNKAALNGARVLSPIPMSQYYRGVVDSPSPTLPVSPLGSFSGGSSSISGLPGSSPVGYPVTGLGPVFPNSSYIEGLRGSSPMEYPVYGQRPVFPDPRSIAGLPGLSRVPYTVPLLRPVFPYPRFITELQGASPIQYPVPPVKPIYPDFIAGLRGLPPMQYSMSQLRTVSPDPAFYSGIQPGNLVVPENPVNYPSLPVANDLHADYYGSRAIMSPHGSLISPVPNYGTVPPEFDFAKKMKSRKSKKLNNNGKTKAKTGDNSSVDREEKETVTEQLWNQHQLKNNGSHNLGGVTGAYRNPTRPSTKSHHFRL